MTTIYFIRHSEPMKVKTRNYNDSIQLKNEKNILSVKGEKRAKVLSQLPEFDNIDLVVASNYVRTIATAKYVAEKNNLDIFIEEEFCERKQGVEAWSDFPSDFEVKQMVDEYYKIGNGESQIEVKERMYNALLNILEQHKDKKIAIFSHGTAMCFLFKKWCHVIFEEVIWKMSFNDKMFFENKFNAPEIFKLTFNDTELISIQNIRPNELNF